MKLLRCRDKNQFLSSILMIEDCCDDYPIIERSPHSKKQRKSALAELDRLKKAITALEIALQVSQRHIDIEYEHHKKAILRTNVSNPSHSTSYDDIAEELRHLRFCIDIVSYKDQEGEEPLILGDNKARTHIVECAYSLSLWFEQPSFVTTPGSDFSLLCALIFELATGTPDESFAGAINKFSKSSLRKDLDQREDETRSENSDEYYSRILDDNFSEKRTVISALKKRLDFWEKLQSFYSPTQFGFRQVQLRRLDVMQQILEARNAYGPFLLFASQYSDLYFQDFRTRFEQDEKALFELDVKIGRTRRSNRKH